MDDETGYPELNDEEVKEFGRVLAEDFERWKKEKREKELGLKDARAESANGNAPEQTV